MNAYRLSTKDAWGHDEIKPLALVLEDPRNGWGATILGSLTTLHMMKLREEFEAASNFTININFRDLLENDLSSSLFETTTHFLGSIISAYELSGHNDTKLLQRAQELGDKLQIAWDPSHSSAIPDTWQHPAINARHNQNTKTVAGAGSLTLEFNQLSYWTKNHTYRLRAEATSRNVMANPQSLPGLHSQTSFSTSGEVLADSLRWGANTDSFFEYAVKYWQLVGEPAKDFIDFWQDAIDSAIEKLLLWSPDNKHPYLAEYSREGLKDRMSHLACFSPGNWMLGARLLKNEAIFNLGLALAETCYHSYNSTSTGVGPETFTYNKGTTPTALDRSFNLHPQVAESIWYAWRLTGDPIWQERAWTIYEALERHCKTSEGYTGLIDVTDLNSKTIQSREPFLIGELFKYLYLTFSDRNYYSLDEWVFSTRGHPFKSR